MFKLRLRPLATVNRSVDNVKSVGLEFKICTLTIDQFGFKNITSLHPPYLGGFQEHDKRWVFQTMYCFSSGQVYTWVIASSFVCSWKPPGMADAMHLKPNWSIVNAWAMSGTKKCDVMFKLRPSSTGYWRRHRSVDNVKPVAFEFKIWVVNMLSVRWERGSCAVALMLRADITQMERRLHTAQPI